MLSEEQKEKIKEQLLKQIENFPEEKREEAKKQILSMDSETLENFLKKNNLIKDSSDSPNPSNSQKNGGCLFCSIISGEINSYKIGEDEKAIAILELNPISKGHSLIIPLKHDIEKIDEETKNLAEKISERIRKELSPKEVKLFATEIFGHKIVNVLPIYNEEDSNSGRKKATEEELKELQEILTKDKTIEQKDKETDEKIQKDNKNTQKEESDIEPKITDENTWLPVRIP